MDWFGDIHYAKIFTIATRTSRIFAENLKILPKEIYLSRHIQNLIKKPYTNVADCFSN